MLSMSTEAPTLLPDGFINEMEKNGYGLVLHKQKKAFVVVGKSRGDGTRAGGDVAGRGSSWRWRGEMFAPVRKKRVRVLSSVGLEC